MAHTPSGTPAGSGQPGTHLTHGAHPHVVPRHPRLDPLADRYAARTHGMKTSEIRALFSVVSRPEVVSLAGGMPGNDVIDLVVPSETLVHGEAGETGRLSDGARFMGFLRVYVHRTELSIPLMAEDLASCSAGQPTSGAPSSA